MSYFDYFTKTTNNEASAKGNNEAIQGTCNSMCPEEEQAMREKAKMVHVLEVIDGRKMLVKCYSRSAADSVVAVPALLRPNLVLRRTVRHVLFVVTKRTDVSATVMYDFLTDRLRAVRQDMTIQRLAHDDCIKLLEPMIRFHTYFGYKLCEYPIQVYDPVLNKKLLLECLKWYLSCYDSLDQYTGFLKETLDLSLSVANIDFTSDGPETKCDRILMESLYILCNLDDVHPIFRYWTLTKEMKRVPSLKLAYEIALANFNGNYIRVCKQLENLCPLTYCALCLHLPKLQRRALQVMSVAYNKLSIPTHALRDWLRFNSADEGRQVCQHYGLAVERDAVKFLKADFRGDVALHPPAKQLLQDEKMDLSIVNIITYVTEKQEKAHGELTADAHED